ncbi:MAG: hypothetical protein WDZ94_05655 [Patescibacteria group bacterium]
MGALPKNKITRAERGKRRAGNTPTITKDFRITAIPNHKKGIVDSIFAAIGLTNAQKKTADTAKDTTTETVKKSHQATVDNPLNQPVANVAATSHQPMGKATRKTQHKG